MEIILSAKRIKTIVILCTVLSIFSCKNPVDGGQSGGTSSNPVDVSVPSALSLTGTVSTFAGFGSRNTDGIGAAARFDFIGGMTCVGSNLFVTDPGSDTIRKIVLATAEVTTFAGSAGDDGYLDGTGSAARFNEPSGITNDGVNLYVIDDLSMVRKIVIATGVVSTFAGSNTSSGSSDGIGTAATFSRPMGITCDGTNLYISDSNTHKIRKIVISTAQVTTIAGGSSGSSDGTGSAASFYEPAGMVAVGGNLYICDEDNRTIRKMNVSTGAVTTFAGTVGVIDSVDGIGSAARFMEPSHISTDGSNLFVTDCVGNKIRKIEIATAAVSTVAGSEEGYKDAVGIAAQFEWPTAIATVSGRLFVGDNSHTIRSIDLATTGVTTFAGLAAPDNCVDGTGTNARFDKPNGMVCVGTSLFVIDEGNNTIRKIEIPSASVTTFAGSPNESGSIDGSGTAARFSYLGGIATDGLYLYVTDESSIRKVSIASGYVNTLAGIAGEFGSIDGVGTTARFNWPVGIVRVDGDLYVNTYSNVRKIEIETGIVTTLAGHATDDGSVDGIGSAVRFDDLEGIASDGTNLYVADSENQTIRKIVISTGEVTTLAGLAGMDGATDGVGAAARFNYPIGLFCDGTNLYVSQFWYSTIRKIRLSDANVTTFAGSPVSQGYRDGPISNSRFYSPQGFATDGTCLFVADTSNSTIRKIQ